MRKQFAARSLAAFGIALLLAACGGGGHGDQPDNPAMVERGFTGRNRVIRAGLDANRAYTEAVDMKARGDCKGAVQKLRPVANLGPGYENAQTALGQCLLELAGNSELSSDYLEGMTWLSRAADAGWPEAQIALAQTHALGPAVIRTGEEAAYWLALYEDNPEKSRVGFVPTDPSAIDAIKARLSATDLAAGKSRAGQWKRKVWMPATPGNAPGLTTREMQQQNGGPGPG